MTVYVLQYFIWFIICREASRIKLRIFPDRFITGKFLCVFIFFLYVALISMLRSTTVGIDTVFYSRGYTYVARAASLSEVLQRQSKSAFVFVTIEYMLGRISDSPQLYIAVFSLIVAVCFASYVYRASSNIWFSCWLYVGMNAFYNSMNIMRQYTAAGFALNAYLYLADNLKSFWGWLLYVVAIGIHPSCIAFIPAIFLSHFCRRRSVKKVTLYAVVLSSVAFLVWTVVYNIFVSMFPGYTSYSMERVSEDMQEHGNYILYIFYLCILLLYTIRRWHSPVSSKYYINTLMGSLMGILFYSNELILRVVLYYNLLLICFIPEIFSKYPKNEQKILYVICFIGLFCYATRHILLGGHRINPYTFFFLPD